MFAQVESLSRIGLPVVVTTMHTFHLQLLLLLPCHLVFPKVTLHTLR
jgi:hypothetical protein